MNPFGNNTALIGHTGFVGSNLAAQAAYTQRFNRQNIAAISGQSFDAVVCAGVQAVKYWANQNPAEDWAQIERLLEPLKGVQTQRFILISTVDVYPKPLLVSETDEPSAENHAYGRHRLQVEQFVRETFPVHHIVRLPGLFGPGLKKNVIFDLLHDNGLDNIQPASAFQYYNLRHLTRDLERVIQHDLHTLNVATEPVSTQAIIDRCTPGKVVGAKAGAPGFYDFRSQHDQLWGRSDGYLYGAEQVLEEIAAFMAQERSAS